MRGGAERPSSPPRWLLQARWGLQRALVRRSGGRFGLHAAEGHGLGTLQLRTLGRRTGQGRATLLHYLDDDGDLAVVAANGGAEHRPGWWHNLQAAPEAFVDLPDGIHAVIARTASPGARDRLWPRFVSGRPEYARFAAATERALPIVLLRLVDDPLRGSRDA